jgi:triacylglycerol lipase
MAMKHRVYLIPGFFGFTQLGDKEEERIAYFQHVPGLLEQRIKARNLDAQVIPVGSAPTAGLEARARSVLQEMAKTETEDGAVLHLIGHSTGGLDARCIVSPRMAAEAPAFVKRVRTVVTISTPHHGTPMATVFNQGDVGKALLRYLWLFTYLALHRKAMPLRTAVLQAVYRLTRLGDSMGVPPNLFTEVARLMATLSENERVSLNQYFEQIGEHQELIRDLTPAGVEDFNRSTPDREGVRYGSVVTGAPPPSLLRRLSLRLLLPPDSFIYGIFASLYALSAPLSPTLKVPERTAAENQLLTEALGRKFEAWSDGIVPSRSQLWGQLFYGVTADHMDVMGHFDQPEQYISWLKSGSNFHEPDFFALWERVLDFTMG